MILQVGESKPWVTSFSNKNFHNFSPSGLSKWYRGTCPPKQSSTAHFTWGVVIATTHDGCMALVYFPTFTSKTSTKSIGNIYQPPLFLMLATSCYPLFFRSKNVCHPIFDDDISVKRSPGWDCFRWIYLKNWSCSLHSTGEEGQHSSSVGSLRLNGWRLVSTMEGDGVFHELSGFFFRQRRSQNPFCLGGNQEYTILWMSILWC